MYKIVIFLVLVKTIQFAKGKPSLVIYESTNGTEVPVTSTIFVRSGDNLTLTCKISFSDKSWDNQIVWSKKSDFGYYMELKVDEPSKLNFRPVILQHGGTYICSSIKYNLSTIVPVIVITEMVERKLKRAQFGFAAKQAPTYMPPVNFPDPLKDILERVLGISKYKDASINTGRHNFPRNNDFNTDFFDEGSDSWTGGIGTSSYPSRPHENSITKWVSENNGSSRNTLYKKVETDYPSDTVNDTNNSKTKSEYGVLYFMAAIGGLLLFSGIMCMCIRNNPNLRMQLERPAPVITVCSLDHPHNAGPATSNEVMTIVTVDQLTDISAPHPTSDSPPSYANSMRTKQSMEEDLPPSYDEAMANMSLTPSYYIYYSRPSTTPDVAASSNRSSATPPPDVILDAPRGFAQFIPRFLVNRR